MSDVYLKRISREELSHHPEVVLAGIERSQLFAGLLKDEFVGCKIHFGEKGNSSYIDPSWLLATIKALKKIKTRPFLVETNTLYRGERMNAIDHINLASGHGFSKLNIPIIIADGLRGADTLEVESNVKHFKTCFLGQAFRDIDFLLVLSHLTGHMLTGFGAAIKNIGMGCASRRGKLAQHCQVSPFIKEARCIGCHACAKECPVNAIERRGEKYFIIKETCIGCAQCVSVCPQGAVDITWSEEYNLLGEKMVEYAYALTRGRRCGYINFCLYITKECDCMNKEKNSFVKDIGVLFSKDPVSIDKASIDCLLHQEGSDVLRATHPAVDYLHHLHYAQEIGLGSLDYRLIEL
ncbi:MAG: DUF362 domain-containing protein [Candidatus Omnitrophota bacterium]